LPSKCGDYIYFLKTKDFSKKEGAGAPRAEKDKLQGFKQSPSDINSYEVYYRFKNELMGKVKSKEEGLEKSEVILDLEEVPFITQKYLRKTIVDKVKMNDDHSLIGFTLDIGNTETLTGGVKDMQTN
jgi:hypothetical protein